MLQGSVISILPIYIFLCSYQVICTASGEVDSGEDRIRRVPVSEASEAQDVKISVLQFLETYSLWDISLLLTLVWIFWILFPYRNRFIFMVYEKLNAVTFVPRNFFVGCFGSNCFLICYNLLRLLVYSPILKKREFALL